MPAQAFPVGHPRHIPDSWPALLSRDQLSAYVGISAETLAGILTVSPVDLGVNLLRYRKDDIDRWIEALPARLTPRLQGADGEGKDAAPVDVEAPTDRPQSAVERARRRAEAATGDEAWRRTG